jgi:hypothetical protein
MENPVVVEAGKYLDKVDFIVDLFDNSFVWGSEGVLRASGYTLEEFMKIRNLDTLDKSVNQEEYRKELAEMLVKKHGVSTVLVNSKTGQKIRMTHEYHIFEFKGGWYMAGKGLKVENLP